MENHLKEINAMLGVVGSFVCLSDSSVAAKAMPDRFDEATVETAAQVAAQTLNALETSGLRVAEVDLVYSQGRLLLKNLRGGILAIVCARNINIPLLNLTANVVAKKIAPELKPPKAGPPVAAPPVLAASPIVPQEPIAAETTSPTLEVASHGTTLPIEAVDGKFFNELTRGLSRIIGPAGGVVIEDEIDALKETQESFPKERASELVERVSLAIRDETKRARFKQDMSEAIRKL